MSVETNIQETNANQAETPPPTFHRWRWLWVWLLLVGTAIAIMIAAATVVSTVFLPTMLLFGALSGPIAFATFVGDRADIRNAVPLFNLVLIVLFSGAIGILVAGVLNAMVIGKQPTPLTIWWVGPIEESSKLILPVAIFIWGRRYRSVRTGLVLGLASASGFAVLESMSYGMKEVFAAGALLAAEAELQGADRIELIKALVSAGKQPIIRGLTTPFGHLVWTGLITTVWWSEWEKRGGIRITGSVIGVFILVILLHSSTDFFLMAPAMLAEQNQLFNLLIYVFPIIFLLSFVLFWRTVKKRVPMQKHE